MQFQSHVRFIESSPLLKLMVMLFGVASVMDVHGGEIAAWTATTRWPPASFTECLVTSGGFRGVPAAASAVASLPETTVTAGGDGEETSCAVCLEGYTASDALRTMPCAHAFHGECIVEWLSVSSFCPLCRFRLPTQAEEDAAGQHQQAARLG